MNCVMGISCDGRQGLPVPRETVKGRNLALRWEDLPRRARRSNTHTASGLNKQFTASRRGKGRANAPSRRTKPVTMGLAKPRIIPPSSAGRPEHLENIVNESSPFASAFQAVGNTPETALENLLQPVAPVRPASGYLGGKRNLARRLIERIAATPHTTYAEVFVGMGGVFLRRTARPRVEVINDWSEDVSTFFRILQRHYVAFIDMLRYQVTSRAAFQKLAAQEPASLTDLERAARFIYLQRLAFGGHVARRTFGVDTQNPARFDVTKLVPLLEAIHERMSGVVIERLPWATFIDRYDRPGTLFYLDPPYFGCEDDYGKGLFDRAQFAAMASRLARLKGRFILSLNDRPEVRETFAAFRLEPVHTTYTIAAGSNATQAGELIISGPECGRGSVIGSACFRYKLASPACYRELSPERPVFGHFGELKTECLSNLKLARQNAHFPGGVNRATASFSPQRANNSRHAPTAIPKAPKRPFFGGVIPICGANVPLYPGSHRHG